MRRLQRFGKVLAVLAVFALSGLLAHRFGAGELWRGFDSPLAIAKPGEKKKYDLTRLEAVNATLNHIRDRYVDPDRIKPRTMLLSALNHIQRDVAQVIVLPNDDGTVTVRVDTHEKKLRVDNVLGPWDVAAKLREVFAFLQKHLRGTEVDLRDVEYAACNGILRTLDPHSVFLSPDAYREMNLSTSGHFGGLGIVISIRDQLLTIIRPMAGTPAGRAGLKRYDRVMKINNESTLNMPLDDAVRRLRGKPGTKVTVWIERSDEWEGTREFVLERERIRVPSVLARRLDGGIAYVRLKQFQQTSEREMRAAIQEIRDEGPIKGLVLDLRGNPGGLLDQAAKVADMFLERGDIVVTVGSSDGREVKRARIDGTEPEYPLVVLVNQSSASASEIVAGAMKNLDRAVIVGESTFGKGSVQLVFPDVTTDKAALKLTIAQYLTPGDKSIQSVGVTPHIELDPMTVDVQEMDLTIQRDGVREEDLSQHLSNSRAAKPARPAQVVRFYLSKKQRNQLRERGGELDDEFQLDFSIEFARDLVQRMKLGPGATQQLASVRGFIDDVGVTELEKVSNELSNLDVNWTVPSTKPLVGPSKDDFDVQLETDQPSDTVTAGETLRLKVSVTNNGTVPVYRLRATTDSDNPYFDEKELVFGKIEPGETKTAVSPLSWCDTEGRKPGSTRPVPEDAKRVCRVPKDALSRSDGVKVHFDAAGGHTPGSAELRPTIQALPRPLFQYSYQISDNLQGNGDGLLQRGERATMYLTVKNVGPGASRETQANLANRSGEGVLLRKGRFDISNMKPGDVRHVAFTFDVQQQLQEDQVVLGLSVGDRDLREFANEKIKLPIVGSVQLAAADGSVTTKRQARLFGDAQVSGVAFGLLPAGVALQRLATANGAVKVRVDGERFAFIKSDAVTSGGRGGSEVVFDQVYSHAPPTLNVSVGAMATRTDKVKIKVEAFDSEQLLDMYMFVGPRKLFYQSNRKGADRKSASFEFDAPLRPGVNIITVVARENPDTTTRRTVVVRRDGPDGSILKTPKHNSDLLDPLR